MFIITIPIKKPKLLWIISSTSNIPLHKTNCINSIEKEIQKPINNPTFIFAGPNLKEDEIIVIIFGQQMFLTCSVPIKILEQ